MRPRPPSIAKSVALYAGYARGLEESGTAPPNAANRNQPLPAIITEQKDGGVRFNLSKREGGGRRVRPEPALFRLRRRQRLQAGGNGPQPRRGIFGIRRHHAEARHRRRRHAAQNQGHRLRRGRRQHWLQAGRPADASAHRQRQLEDALRRGLELDMAVSHRGRTPATTDNLVFIPRARAGRPRRALRFKIARRERDLPPAARQPVR